MHANAVNLIHLTCVYVQSALAIAWCVLRVFRMFVRNAYVFWNNFPITSIRCGYHAFAHMETHIDPALYAVCSDIPHTQLVNE